MRRTRTGRALLAAAATTFAVAILGPAPAGAGYTPQIDGAILVLNGDDQGDQLLVTQGVGGAIVFTVNNGPVQETGATLNSVSVIRVEARGGGDEVRLTNGLPSGDLRGGDGTDTLFGGSGLDSADGGAGDDFIDLNIGNDNVVGGAGDDTVQWDPGDGSDTIDGGAGDDTHVFNGSNIGEVMGLSVIPGTTDLSLTRNVAGINETLRGVEHIRNVTLGGQDFFNATDNLTPTGLKTLEVDLGPNTAGATPQRFDGSDVSDIGTAGPGIDEFNPAGGDDTWKWTGGDGADLVNGGEGTDRLAVAGTDEEDVIRTRAKANSRVGVSSDTPADGLDVESVERISFDGRGGDDRVIPFGDVGPIATFVLDGGPGKDVLEGTSGADLLRGGEGDDALFGRGGDDQLFGDAGTDELHGGPGSDSFACGGLGDFIDATADDSVGADCLKPADPQTEPQQPGPDPQQQGQGPQQQQDDGLPRGFLGFGRPAVRATGGGLSVTLKSTSAKPIRLKLSATEKAGGRGKSLRYRTVTKTIAPGAKVKIALKAPLAVRRQIARGLQRSGKVVRKPTLTIANVDTGGKRTLKPRVTLKQH
jgi:Ca2+-binding RTX toxin-like protein